MNAGRTLYGELLIDACTRMTLRNVVDIISHQLIGKNIRDKIIVLFLYNFIPEKYCKKNNLLNGIIGKCRISFFGKLQKQKAKGIIRNERLSAIFLFCHNEISSW